MILQACTECDRQYDVSHLSVGAPIRCVCDARLVVASPRALTVRARRCSNCGGRVEEERDSCGYCGSKLLESEVPQTLCPACFTRIDEDAKHCGQCGVAIIPQALTALRDGQRCPRCKSSLCVRAMGHASVVECTECAGIWLTSTTFEDICRRAQERPDVRLAAGAPSIAQSQPERRVTYIPCLTCDEMMLRRNFRYQNAPSHVVLDYCREHGVWLDPTELERIVAFIRRTAGNPDHVRPQSTLDRPRSGGPGGASSAPSGRGLQRPIRGRNPGGWALEASLWALAELVGDLFD